MCSRCGVGVGHRGDACVRVTLRHPQRQRAPAAAQLQDVLAVGQFRAFAVQRQHGLLGLVQGFVTARVIAAASTSGARPGKVGRTASALRSAVRWPPRSAIAIGLWRRPSSRSRKRRSAWSRSTAPSSRRRCAHRRRMPRRVSGVGNQAAFAEVDQGHGGSMAYSAALRRPGKEGADLLLVARGSRRRAIAAIVLRSRECR